jgi:carboxymethylenebutenolidase
MPAQGGPFPTVLVVQEVFGVHEHIKDICRRLAKAGYYAIAPELNARQGNPAKISDIQELVQKIGMKVPTDQVMSEAYAKASKADATKLAVTGFCWGGWATCMYSEPEFEGSGRVVRLRSQAHRADTKEPPRHRE